MSRRTGQPWYRHDLRSTRASTLSHLHQRRISVRSPPHPNMHNELIDTHPKNRYVPPNTFQYAPVIFFARGEMKNFPDEYRDLLKEKPGLIFFLQLYADGSPQVTPVWFNADDEYILINTNEGRVKDKNMKARPRSLWLSRPEVSRSLHWYSRRGNPIRSRRCRCAH